MSQESERDPGVNLDLYSTNNLYEYQYEDMVTSLILGFLFCSRADFVDFNERFTELVSEVSEDCMPFSFTLDEDFDSDNMIEIE